MRDNNKDVYTYASQALDMLEREKDVNPNYNEIKQLLHHPIVTGKQIVVGI